MSKKIPKPKEYSDRQVQKRHRLKSDKIEALKGDISGLRAKARKDLASDDPKTKVQALLTLLIDTTYARVGNRSSEKENGHYGVTGLLKKHLKFEGGDAVFRYVGKSGVSQKKVVSDKGMVKAIREYAKGVKPGDPLFTYGYDGGTCQLDSKGMSDYLADFGVTSKDLRGYHANIEMTKILKSPRSKGPALSKDKKEREKTLKDEYKEALDHVSKLLGHEANTLNSQYLVPGYEETYLKEGKPMKVLNARKIASLVVNRFMREASPLMTLRDLSVDDLVTDRQTSKVYRVDDINPHKRKVYLVDIDTDREEVFTTDAMSERLQKIPAYMASRMHLPPNRRARVASDLGALVSQIHDHVSELESPSSSPGILEKLRGAVGEVDELVFLLEREDIF